MNIYYYLPSHTYFQPLSEPRIMFCCTQLGSCAQARASFGGAGGANFGRKLQAVMGFHNFMWPCLIDKTRCQLDIGFSNDFQKLSASKLTMFTAAHAGSDNILI